MPNKDELLQSITPGMKLDKAFFFKVYGYEISYPGFSETAIKALEDAGCSKARRYYERITAEYEAEQATKLKPVAAWLREEIDRDFDEKAPNFKKGSGGHANKNRDWHRFKGFPSIR